MLPLVPRYLWLILKKLSGVKTSNYADGGPLGKFNLDRERTNTSGKRQQQNASILLLNKMIWIQPCSHQNLNSTGRDLYLLPCSQSHQCNYLKFGRACAGNITMI